MPLLRMKKKKQQQATRLERQKICYILLIMHNAKSLDVQCIKGSHPGVLYSRVFAGRGKETTLERADF